MRFMPRGDHQTQRAGVLFGLVVFMLFILAAVILAWMVLLPRAVTSTVSELTGFPTRIDKFSANPFTGSFEGESLLLQNSAEWGGETFAEVGALSGSVKLLSLREPTVVLPELTVHLDRLVIIVDPTGRTNVEAIGRSAAITVPAGDAALPIYATAGWFSEIELPSDVLIERLVLRIATIEIHDLGTAPVTKIVDDLAYEHTYTNVRTYEQLISRPLLTRLAKSPAVFQVLLSSGLLGGADATSPSGLQRLFQRASGAVNSFLQGLEQTGKP